MSIDTLTDPLCHNTCAKKFLNALVMALSNGKELSASEWADATGCPKSYRGCEICTANACLYISLGEIP